MEYGIPSKIYSKHILELYKNSSNFGNLKDANYSATESNSVCGDEITIQLLVKKGIVKQAKFSGSGCVLSIVASSLFTSKIKGMKIQDIKRIKKEDVLKLLRIKIGTSRRKCVFLPIEAVQKALK